MLSDGWQAALGAEQQAAFGYALVGPHLSGADVDRARALQALHEQLRDQATAAVAALGAQPQAPQGDYPALYPGLASPRQLAATLEDTCGRGWRYLYSVAAGDAGPAGVRRTAQQQLTAATVRAVQWRARAGGPPSVAAFPGT